MTDPVLRALLDICGPGFARHAGPADTVAGRQAAFVAAPGTAQAVVALLRLAAGKGHAVVPRGAGTKIDWGAAPSRVDLLLDTGRLAGVFGHAPDGTGAEIGAGTPVRAAQAALARHGLRLAVDPPSAGATLGGVLAIDEAGPLRQRFGSPCDQVLGARHVDFDGLLTDIGTHPGGTGVGARPLDELCGPHGSRGVIVSATVRVQPVPAARLWVTRSVWSPLEVHELVRQALDVRLDPAAIEVDLPAFAGGVAGRGATSTGRDPGGLAMLLEGDPASVSGRAARLVDLLGGDAGTAGTAPSWWDRYPFTAEHVAVRITVPISDLHAAVYALSDAAGAAVPVRGSAGAGVLHAALAGDTPPQRVAEIIEAVRGVLMARGGRCVVLAAPPAVRAALELEGDEALD